MIYLIIFTRLSHFTIGLLLHFFILNTSPFGTNGGFAPCGITKDALF
ncbi:hypothetical protein [Lysinibacillus parviboronicapiens]|nr:hypothetical protein [Lysinibacillus parviboronicapiens]